MRIIELNLQMECLAEVPDVKVEHKDQGSVKLTVGDVYRFVPGKHINSYDAVGFNRKYVMVFRDGFEVDEKLAYNGFIDAIIAGKGRQVDILMKEYREKENQINKKIAYFEGLKKK